MSENIVKSISEENLAKICEHTPSKRGRKQKYATDEERIEARRQQQREYRLRKKHELTLLRKMVEEKKE